MALWNATTYDWRGGYDAAEHRAYADLLVEEGEVPRETGEYYTPPGFYAVAGGAVRLGEALGLGEPERAAQVVNAALVVVSAVLVYALARALWPERRLLPVASLAFFVACPIALKAAAMFHPETLSLFVSTAALLLAARMLVRRSFALVDAAAVGVALGAAQLVRAFALWTVGTVLLTLLVAALADTERRAAGLRALAVVAVVAAAVPAPWYVHQARLYTNPVFDRPQPDEPLWERRPASFYVDLGLPQVLTEPIRPSFSTSFLPVLYTETWGDYFGVWAWGPAKGGDADEGTRALLGVQSVAGLLPTLVALAGWAALLGLGLRFRRERPCLLLPALLPAAGLAGLLYFTVSYPTPDGDTIKGLYLLTTLPAWSLAFGLGADRLVRRPLVGLPLAIALGASLLLGLRFGVYAWA